MCTNSQWRFVFLDVKVCEYVVQSYSFKPGRNIIFEFFNLIWAWALLLVNPFSFTPSRMAKWSTSLSFYVKWCIWPVSHLIRMLLMIFSFWYPLFIMIDFWFCITLNLCKWWLMLEGDATCLSSAFSRRHLISLLSTLGKATNSLIIGSI